MKSIRDEIWWFRGAVVDCCNGRLTEDEVRAFEAEVESRKLTPDFVARNVDMVRTKAFPDPHVTAEKFYGHADSLKVRLLRRAVLAPEF